MKSGRLKLRQAVLCCVAKDYDKNVFFLGEHESSAGKDVLSPAKTRLIWPQMRKSSGWLMVTVTVTVMEHLF
jgi:hypothetical protein